MSRIDAPIVRRRRHQLALDAARSQYLQNRTSFTCELSPQLIGLEGHRVEVVTCNNERRRFIVGKSVGWIPIHLEIARRDSTGGIGAEREYQTVRDLGRVR
jgi:hypothetical protein